MARNLRGSHPPRNPSLVQDEIDQIPNIVHPVQPDLQLDLVGVRTRGHDGQPRAAGRAVQVLPGASRQTLLTSFPGWTLTGLTLCTRAGHGGNMSCTSLPGRLWRSTSRIDGNSSGTAIPIGSSRVIRSTRTTWPSPTRPPPCGQNGRRELGGDGGGDGNPHPRAQSPTGPSTRVMGVRRLPQTRGC